MGGRSGQSIGGRQEIKGALILREPTNKEQYYSDREIKKLIYLTGIPKDFKGVVYVREVDENSVRIAISKDGLRIERLFNTKTKEVENEYFVIEKNSKYKGKGIEIFKDQVDRLINEGNYKRIVTDAAGFRGSQYNGYYTWLRAGYRPVIAEKGIVSNFNSYLRGMGYEERIKKSSDIVKSPYFLEIWKDIGERFRGEFELSKSSESYQILKEYLNSRNERN